jgi:hypothetical protein
MLQILSVKILTSFCNSSKKENGYKIKGIAANRLGNGLQESDQVNLLYLKPSYSTIVFVPVSGRQGNFDIFSFVPQIGGCIEYDFPVSPCLSLYLPLLSTRRTNHETPELPEILDICSLGGWIT